VKRRDLEKRMRRHGCSLKREGGNHSIWHNADNGSTVPFRATVNLGIPAAHEERG
jgi:predicted RNA binding protein YcfA (HicA-like mRNA interferase family)